MQVLWLDPNENEAKGVLLVPPADVVAGATIDWMKKHLATKLLLDNVARSTLRLYGQRLTHGRLESYAPRFESNIPRFVFSYKLASPSAGDAPKTSIFVQMLGGNLITVRTNPLTTVADVSEEIECKSGIPREEHRLLYGGAQLRRDRKLVDYGIDRNATLHFSLRLNGGLAYVAPSAKFFDVSNEDTLEVRQFSTSAPLWRMVQIGLNVEGICNNNGCDAFGQLVIAPTKWRPFNLLRHNLRCPLCSSSIVPKTCGFYQCQWRFEGIQTVNGMYTSSPWKAAKGEVYHRFQQGKSVSWQSLLVVATPLDNKGCGLCFASVDGLKQPLVVLPCSHKFDFACFKAATAACDRRGVSMTCPTCWAPIAIP